MKFTSKGVKVVELTREFLLERVNEYSIWCYYTGLDIKMGKKVLSPVRKERDPSAVFFVSSKGNILLKDYGGETWNLWKYLNYRNIDLLQVFKDFGLVDTTQGVTPSRIEANGLIKHFTIPEGVSSKIKVKRKRWNQRELQFWADYHISKETLDFYNIHPLQCYWITKGEEYAEYCKKENELVFLFSFGNAFYKIYRPEGDKKRNKWYSNTPKDILMGFDQLPWVGEVLIVTKGMKELCILKELNIPAIALQGETSYPDKEIMHKLFRRFKSTYSIMDTDKAGVTATKYFENTHCIKPIVVPKYKDLAEFTKGQGLKNTKYLIESQL